MTKRFEDLNDSEVLILFKLTGLSRSFQSGYYIKLSIKLPMESF